MTTSVIAYPPAMRFLSVMLVTSLVLAGIIVMAPGVAQAEFYCNWQYQERVNVSCGGVCGAWVGWSYGCWQNLYYQRCCNAYQCWYTGQSYIQSACGCPC